jgi:hypothetical protein
MDEVTQTHRSPATALLRVTSAALVVLALIIVLAITGIAAWVAFLDSPFADHWRWITRIGTLDDVFLRNYDHPIVLGRIAFWLDWRLFDARGRFLEILTLATLAAQAPAFVWLARQASAPMPWRVIGPATTALALAVNGWENVVNPFMLTYVPAWTLALWAFAAFASYARAPKAWMLALCLVAMLAATMTTASGVFVPTLLAIMALTLGRFRLTLVFVVAATAAWIWQTTATSDSHGFAWVSLSAAPAILRYFITLLGAPATRTWSPVAGFQGDINIAFAVGLIILVLSSAALLWVALRARKEPALLALGGVITLALLTAAVTAAGRFILGIEYAITSRYYVNEAVLWAALLVVLICMGQRMAAKHPPLRLPLDITAPVAALLLVALAVSGVQMLRMLFTYHRTFQLGVSAFVAGVDDDEARRQVLGWETKELGYEGAALLRQQGKWLFADPVTRRVGERLSADETSAATCGTGAWTISQPHPGGFRVAGGSFARHALSAGAPHILIADASGVVIGYGRIPRRPSDLNPLARNDGRVVDWQGYVRPEASGPLQAWVSDASYIRCALGPGAAEPPSAPA